MTGEAMLTGAVVAGVLVTLIATRVPADFLFAGALAVLIVTGVVSPAEGLSGFANEGVITVAVLYVVVAGIRQTGGVQRIASLLLGRPRHLAGAQVRLTAPVAFFSAFLNNTPIVAMLIPAVRDWARAHDLPVSKLLIPLSYAAMLGGMCTLVGTSPILVAHGLLLERRGTGLGFFEIAWVGVPVAVVGLAFMIGTSRWLLPDRRESAVAFGDPREYTVEMTVDGSGPLTGKTVIDSGLADSDLQLIEVHRDGEFYPVVAGQQRLLAGDRLVMAGAVDSVVDLQRRHGLTPASDQVFKLEMPRSDRILVEAVISDTSPLVGTSIREGRFRSRYGAVVVALARNRRRLSGSLRDVTLRPGDTLLLEAMPAFVEQHREGRDFFLVSALPDSHPLRFDRAVLAILVLIGMVASAGLGILSMLQAAMLAAAAMLVMRCMTVEDARRSIDWHVIIVIAASIGVGRAIEVSGLASITAATVVGSVGSGPMMNLVAIFLLTSLFSELVTNNAAVVLMFPIAVSVAASLGADPMPFVIAVVVAAAGAVATPIGYQTNLMVYGPGGYAFTDFLRAGLPLIAVTATVAIIVIPSVWRF
jgi:di/tricarboxylate transporter